MTEGEASDEVERRRVRRFSALVACALLAGLLACVGHWARPEPEGRHRTDPVSGAGSEVGAAACYDCHDSFAGHFVASDAHADCESCHGPAELHAYTAKASDIRYPSSRDCADCHQIGGRELLGWTRSVHERSNVICSDCHDTHNRQLWHLRQVSPVRAALLPHASEVTRMCAGCHPEVTAQLGLPSHHPLAEGMLDCTDCHGAHETRRETLGALTQRCVACHQDVAGPFIYEHAPVTEDCGYCHVPHGASADDLLEASQPAVCISCHTLPIAGAVHQPYAFTTACTDCHSAVHGSFSDHNLRK